MNKTTVTVVFGLLLLGGGLYLVYTNNSETAYERQPIVYDEVFVTPSPIPVPVAGVVSAANQATIYAQTAGVVTVLPYKEGAAFGLGAVLASQRTPVADAEVGLAVARAGLAAAEREAAVAAATASAETASVRAYSAEELATLRTLHNDTRLTESVETLAAAVTANAGVALGAMDYITENRSLFTADGLRQYNETLRLTFGTVPNYFRGGVLYAGSVDVSLKEVLQTIREDTAVTAVEAQNAASITLQVLEALNQVMETAEADVFERNALTPEAKAAYLTQKNAVTATAANVVNVRQAAQQAIDGVLEDAVAQNLSVTVSAIDSEAAATQATFAVAVANAAAATAAAEVAVAEAVRSLGAVAAPFAGVVERVLVEEGEYVQPGTPLVRVAGNGLRELTVTVPTASSKGLAVGQTFTVDGAVVGTVDRFSPSVVGHGRTVVITLTASSVAVGETLRGEILIDTATDVYAVPRAYLHFTSEGPGLLYKDGTTTAVTILQDAGTTLYVSAPSVPDSPLVPAGRSVQ